MAEQQFKRNIAYKLRIGNILSGKPTFEQERFIYLDLNGKRVVRVNIVGSIVDKYESEGERKFLSLTIDDGSGQIKMRAFGDDIEKFNKVSQGQTVIVIGTLRSFNNELYMSPEIMREQDPRYLLVRKLEVEKSGLNQSPKEARNEETGDGSLKEKLIEMIKGAESEGGASLDIIASTLGNPTELNQELQKLLEEGMVFEPRPGVIRWLG